MEKYLEIRRQWGFERHRLTSEGITEGILSAMEKLSIDAQGFIEYPILNRISIHEITKDRESFAAEMDPDLVHPSGEDLDLHQRKRSQDRMIDIFL